MIAAFITSVVAVTFTNLIWIVRHRRAVARLKKAHQADLDYQLHLQWSIAFQAGWDAIQKDYFAVKDAWEKWLRRIEDEK